VFAKRKANSCENVKTGEQRPEKFNYFADECSSQSASNDNSQAAGRQTVDK